MTTTARPSKARHAADDRRIVAVGAIAVQFLKIREQSLDVIEGVWPLRMARDLGHLPCSQVREDVARQGVAFRFQATNF
jgi:hypothetical protein